MRGYGDIVELLLKNVPHVNLDYKSYGRTPLASAANRGHKSVVALLVEHGAAMQRWDTTSTGD